MKSVRLSNDMRVDILSSVLKEYTRNLLAGLGAEKEDDLRKAWQDEEKRVLSGLWDKVYGYPTEEVPAWMLRDDNFSVAVEGLSVFRGACVEGKPGRKYGADIILTLVQHDELFAPMFELIAITDKFKEDVKQMKSEVNSILNSVNTTKQLVELWPAVEQYIPAYIADPDKGVNLPALLISRLDEKLQGTQHA